VWDPLTGKLVVKGIGRINSQGMSFTRATLGLKKRNLNKNKCVVGVECVTVVVVIVVIVAAVVVVVVVVVVMVVAMMVAGGRKGVPHWCSHD